MRRGSRQAEVVNNGLSEQLAADTTRLADAAPKRHRYYFIHVNKRYSVDEHEANQLERARVI